MTEEFSEDPLHFPKDILIYIVYDGYDMDQIQQKMETKESWEAFGYTVYDQPLMSRDECENCGIDLRFTKFMTWDDKRIYYTYAYLWRSFRRQKSPGLIISYNNVLINDLPRKYYDDYNIWLPTKDITIWEIGGDGENMVYSTNKGIKADASSDLIRITAGFDGQIKNVDLLFAGTMFVSYKGARSLVREIVKAKPEYTVSTSFTDVLLRHASEDTICIRDGVEFPDRYEGRKTNKVTSKIVVYKNYDEYGQGNMIGDYWYFNNNGTTGSFYRWLYHKLLPLPDHPMKTIRSWGDVFNIDESKIFIK